MQTQIQKRCNSLGIRIPKNIAKELKLEQGIYVNLDVIENQHHEILNLDYKISKEEW